MLSPDVCAMAAEWLEAHGDLLFRQAYARVWQREAAEDLVQDTLLTAMQRYADFRHESSVETWLVSIIRNKAIDYLRKNSKTMLVDQTPGEQEAVERHFGPLGIWNHLLQRWNADPASVSENKEFVGTLEKCFGKLPERYRRILSMKVFDDMSAGDISREFGITPSTSGVLLFRARTMLRDCLQLNWFKGES